MERQNFHRELENLRLTLYKMAALTRQSFDKSTRAYLDRDSELAQTVIDGDMEVNRIELEIDRQSLRLLGTGTANGARFADDRRYYANQQ
jgi:phosphate transport system protein